jgi:PAS domain S-box-containing protein
LSATQDVARAEAFAQLALTLADRTAAKAVRGRTLFVVGASVSHFSHPFAASIAWLEQSRPLLLEAGELEFAGYASYNLCQHRVLSGQPLGPLEPIFDQELHELQRLGLATSRRWCAIVRQLLRCLREHDAGAVLDGRDFDAGAELPALREAGDDTALAIYHINALLLALLHEDGGEARRQLVRARPCMHGLAEFPAGAAFRFLEPLALLRFPVDEAAQRAQDAEVTAEQLRILGVHARSNPGIFGHRLMLIEGLCEAAAGRPAGAVEAVDAAMRRARQAGLLHEAVLAAQAAAAVAQDWGKPSLAADYRREARADLERWGALALVRRPESGVAALAEVVAADHQLDFESLLKASRLLTGELRIEALPATLLGVVLENAGATLGALVFRQRGRWLVQSRTVHAPEAGPPSEFDHGGGIPSAVVNQVINTRELVLCGQVADDALLAVDAELRRRGVRSLLCLPIQHGAELLGALYLENGLVGDAFPAHRVAVLEVLCAQAGVALKNALLYSDLQRSEGRLRAIVENNVDIITIIDSQGRYTFASPALQRVLGYAEDELVGRLAIEPIHPDDQPAAAAAIMGALATPGSLETVTVRFRHREGHWVDIEAVGRNLVHVPGVEGIVVNTRDISERKRAEAALRQLNDELEARVAQRTAELARTSEELLRAEKLAALGRLVAGVAHELNTPIGNAVLAASTLAGRQREFEAGLTGSLRLSALKSFLLDTGDAADVLERNLQRAAELIGSFKQLAVDQSSYQRRRFELGEVVQEIALALRPTLRRSGVNLVDDTPPGLAMDSFPGPLGQVLANLVDNAVVHAFAEGQGRTVRIAAVALADDRVRLTVADDGRGIAPENLDRVFDPFFTTRLAQGGSGLGLHIVYSLVTGPLGGRIEVRSAPGEGTTFLVELARKAPRTADERNAGAAADPA